MKTSSRMSAPPFSPDSTRSGEEIEALLATADQGRIFREGVRVVIYGATNAGKSSLLNRLLGFPRAIVSETPGTTRDTIEEMVNLRGHRAAPHGYRRTAQRETDAFENEGIARTERSLAQADLVLHVVDASAARAGGFRSQNHAIAPSSCS